MVEEEVVAVTVAAVPGIYIAIQLVKSILSGVLPAKFWPLVAVLIGVAWQVGWTVGTNEFGRESIFLGATSGMAATGLHNLIEVTREGVNKVRNGNSN